MAVYRKYLVFRLGSLMEATVEYQLYKIPYPTFPYACLNIFFSIRLIQFLQFLRNLGDDVQMDWYQFQHFPLIHFNFNAIFKNLMSVII